VLGVALEEHQGQCAAAARSLGLHRITLRKKLQQHGLGGTAE
jgi:DNA-binding protein Fis